MIKVSIITIVFNNKRFIEEAIQSVLGQRYPHIEYIVKDGGSTDGTLDIINKYKSKITKFVSEPDKGLFDGLNKGIGLATGDIVGILHSDDVFFDSHVIETVVREMEEKNADAAWGDLVYVNRDDPQKIVRFWKSSEYREGKFQKGWMPPHTAFFARRRLYEEYGLLRLDLGMAADYELMLRFLLKYHARSCYIPKTLVKMKVGGVSDRSIRNIKYVARSNTNAYKAWKVNGLKINPLRMFLKPLSKIFQSFIKSNQK